MPNSSHLNWLEISDWTPGVHTRNAGTMPHNASQVMQDCYPLKEGGLRAFADDGNIVTTGMDMSTGNQIIAIGGHFGIPHRTVSGLSQDRYVVKYDESDSTIRLYRMDETNSDTTWSLMSFTFATNTAGSWSQSFLVPFVDAGGTRYMLLGLNYGGSGATGPGIYKIKYSDGAVTLIQVAKPTGLIVNQGRWLYAQEESSQLFYSNVGDVGATNQFLDVTPSGPGAVITALAGTEPSDILVGKAGAPWVSITGDISSPNTVVRELSGAHPAGRRPVVPTSVPGGMAFIADNGSIYSTDGRNFDAVGNNVRWTQFDRLKLEPTGNGTVGMTAFIGDYLFLGANLVRDMVTGAIFSILPNLADNLDLWVADHTRGRIWGASLAEAADATMYEYQPVGDGVFRSPQCSWTSAPLVPKSGEDARLREVEVYFQTHGASVNNMTVTRFDQNGANSVARTGPTYAANQHGKITFQFPNLGSAYQYIKIDWNTNGTQTEAATIERLRIGFAPGRGLG